MNVIRAIRSRSGLAAAAACLAMTAWCGASAPGYRHALDDVGRDAQLPLERIAVSGSDPAKSESSPHSERAQTSPPRAS